MSACCLLMMEVIGDRSLLLLSKGGLECLELRPLVTWDQNFAREVEM